MFELIWNYCFVGFCWLIFCDLFIQRMPNNSVRLRYLFLWPVTLTAFLMGVYDAWRNHKDDE